MKSRRCYATTGSRMILWMSLNGYPMGSEVVMSPRQPRIVEFEAHGTDHITTVELVRNSQVFAREEVGKREDVSFSWEDSDPFRDVALPSSAWTKVPFIYYYVRLTQTDGETGWTSPVWVEEGG